MNIKKPSILSFWSFYFQQKKNNAHSTSNSLTEADWFKKNFVFLKNYLKIFSTSGLNAISIFCDALMRLDKNINLNVN